MRTDKHTHVTLRPASWFVKEKAGTAERPRGWGQKVVPTFYPTSSNIYNIIKKYKLNTTSMNVRNIKIN